MKNVKMLLVPGMVIGLGVMLSAADTKSVTVPAPDAQTAGKAMLEQMNKPQGTPVAKAFDFLPAVVAKANGKDVTKAEFIDAMAKQVPGGVVPAQVPAELLKMQAPQMVEQYVTRLVLEKAFADSKMTVTADEIAAQLKAELAKMPKDQRNMYEQMLKAKGKTVDDEIKAIANDKNAQKMIAFQKFLESKAGKVAVTAAEVEKFYKDNPDQFKEPADGKDTIRASHILVKVDKDADAKTWEKAKKEIEAIIAQLKKGADFGKLAAEKSACPSGKSANGSLGAFGKGQMVSEFEKAAYALKVGEISGAVKTEYGYHVIRRDASQEGRTMAFAEVKDRLTAALTQQKQMMATQKAINEMMKAAKVQILVKAEMPKMPAAPKAAPKAPAKAK
ncbi:MAG: hypothetical protein E7039_02030 [Lentisphaerae bacterium]|nr:hypothetical protein [Lentisphaerota bacterium]